MFLEFFISLEGLFAEQVMRYVKEPFRQRLDSILIIRPVMLYQCLSAAPFYKIPAATSVLRQHFCQIPKMIGDASVV